MQKAKISWLTNQNPPIRCNSHFHLSLYHKGVYNINDTIMSLGNKHRLSLSAVAQMGHNESSEEKERCSREGENKKEVNIANS